MSNLGKAMAEKFVILQQKLKSVEEDLIDPDKDEEYIHQSELLLSQIRNNNGIINAGNI